jgi:hypothetical protein
MIDIRCASTPPGDHNSRLCPGTIIEFACPDAYVLVDCQQELVWWFRSGRAHIMHTSETRVVACLSPDREAGSNPECTRVIVPRDGFVPFEQFVSDYTDMPVLSRDLTLRESFQYLTQTALTVVDGFDG